MNNIRFDYDGLRKMIFNIKVKKLHKLLRECMDEDGVQSCLESTERVLKLLPEDWKIAFIDNQIEAVKRTREEYGI